MGAAAAPSSWKYRVHGPLDRWITRPTAEEVLFVNGSFTDDDSDTD